MEPFWRRAGLPYAAAVASVATGLAGRAASGGDPFLPLTLAVALAAFGGARPALLALALAAIGGFWLTGDGARTAFLVATGIAVAGAVAFLVRRGRRAEARWQAVESISGTFAWTTDADGRVVEPIPSWGVFTGQTFADSRGDGWLAAVHPDDRDPSEQAWRKAVAAGTQYECLQRVWHAASGRYRSVLTRGVPVRGPGGAVQGWVGACDDVDDRIRTELALREQIEELETLNELLPVPVWVAHDPECRHVTGNRAAAEVLRLSPGENASVTAPSFERPTHFRVLRHGRELRPEEAPMQAAAAGGKPVLGEEIEIAFDDGTSRHLFGYAAPLFGPGGTVRGCVGAFVDLTPARRTLDQLAAALDASRLGLWEFDLTTGTAEGDTRTRALLGLPPSGPWTLAEWLDRVHPEDRAASEAAYRRCLDPAGDGHSAFEGRLLLPGGAVCWVATTGRVEFAGDGASRRPVRVVGTIRDDTERAEAAAALARSRARLRRIVDSDIVGVIHWDLESSRILDANDRFLEMVGFTRDDLRAGRLDFRAMTPPDWTPRNEQGVAEIRSKRRGTPYEKEYLRKDGSRVPIIIAGALFDDSDREGFSFVLDITELKRVETQLRTSEERYRLATEAISGVVWDWDVAAGRVERSRGMEVLTGFQHGEGNTDPEWWSGLIDPADLSRATAIYRENVARRAPIHETEYRLRHRDGGIRHVWDRAVVLYDDAGRVRRMVGYTLDITDRKRAEQAVAESEEKFRTLADNIPQLAWMGRPDGHLFWYNRRWYEYTGTTPAEMEGWGWKAVHHPDHAQRVVEKWQAHLASGEPWEDTFPLRRHDGTFRWHLSRAQPIRDDAGRIVRWFGTNTDITEQRQLEEALREADRRKDEFLATLAHELRNPLAPVCNALRIFEAGGPTGPAADEARAVLARQVQQLVRLVDDLLDVSRITRGKITLAPERLPVADVVARAIETSRPLIDKAGHSLTVDLPADPLWLDADPVRLSQVFANLLNNAAKYTPTGGQLRLSATAEAGEVVVRVRDDGIGIPAEKLAHVFDLFTQVDTAADKAQGGLGIGLSIVRGLVRLHGGTVSARSDGPGRGCEFEVRLPAAPPPEATESPAELDETPPAVPRRVLIADDNVDAAESLATLLRLAGHEVRTAHGGRAALAALDAGLPEVMILDLGMPGMDGYEVARQVRARPDSAGLLLVALTGWGQPEDRRRTREAGFDHHLVKPVDADELARILALSVRPPG